MVCIILCSLCIVLSIYSDWISGVLLIMLYDYRIDMSCHMLYDCDVDNRTVKCHLYYCITFDFRIRREGCKIRISYRYVRPSGHRPCLWVSPAYLGRPDPLSFKWIGRQFERGLARRNWPSFCGAGVRPILGPTLRQWVEGYTSCMPHVEVEYALIAWMSVFVKTMCRR